MDQFIDVVGTGKAEEEMLAHRAALSIHVRAPSAENAIKQAAELRDECIRVLLGAGLSKSELSEGGAEVYRTWWWEKKNVGQEANHRILINCPESGRMYEALSQLEPLFENKRYTLDISMLSPKFGHTDEAKELSLRTAIAEAQRKARLLAEAAGATLGPVIQVQELSGARTHSGAYGDEDWGYPVAIAGAAAPGGEPVELEGAKREVSARFRVRFGLSTSGVASVSQ